MLERNFETKFWKKIENFCKKFKNIIRKKFVKKILENKIWKENF